jgi:hypothetical protein
VTLGPLPQITATLRPIFKSLKINALGTLALEESDPSRVKKKRRMVENIVVLLVLKNELFQTSTTNLAVPAVRSLKEYPRSPPTALGPLVILLTLSSRRAAAALL